MLEYKSLSELRTKSRNTVVYNVFIKGFSDTPCDRSLLVHFNITDIGIDWIGLHYGISKISINLISQTRHNILRYYRHLNSTKRILFHTCTYPMEITIVYAILNPYS